MAVMRGEGNAAMFTLIDTLGFKEMAKREAIPFAIAFVVAEFFYKFHSFALECLAFLATWYLLSLIQRQISRAGAK